MLSFEGKLGLKGLSLSLKVRMLSYLHNRKTELLGNSEKSLKVNKTL